MTIRSHALIQKATYNKDTAVVSKIRSRSHFTIWWLKKLVGELLMKQFFIKFIIIH